MDILDFLKKEKNNAGGLKNLSKQTSISASYLSDVLNGKREPGKKILEHFGFARKVIYSKRKQDKF